MGKRLTIGVTEPSQFTPECISTIEDFFDANPIKICQNKPENIETTLKLCDGVILAGGVDIHPIVYGESVKNNYGFSRFDLDRDVREIAIISHCIAKGVPLLGICRGHQMLGVYHSLTMVLDLASSALCHQPRTQQISFERNQPSHTVTLTDECLVDPRFQFPEDAIVKKKVKDDRKRIWVNSFHHQGILLDSKAAEQGITVLGTALGNDKEDPIIELMATEKWLSCQWHPEYDWGFNSASRVVLESFKALLEKA